MPTGSELVSELNFYSDRLSTQTRTLALGLLAIIWGILVAQGPVEQNVMSRIGSQLIPVAILAIVSLAADLLQYAVGYASSRSMMRRLEALHLSEVPYTYSNFWYRAQCTFFYGKLAIVTTAAVWLVVSLSVWFFLGGLHPLHAPASVPR